MMPTVVTIDGPAGTGKSTVARLVADQLGFQFLNTGAMYRAVAWQCLQHNIELTNRNLVAEVASQLQFSIQDHQLLVNGKDLLKDSRMEKIGQAASIIASLPDVRAHLVAHQRSLASQQDIVTEGRDQGTVVFPHATCKIFLTARPEIRAQRRYEDLKHQADISYEQILAEQSERDRRDTTRSVAPLKPAEDAITVDSSDLEIDEVIARIVSIVQQSLR
ncbi:MAG: (d)CMP kinase [Planctomycetaceae bacterium]|nr:(d)CMP kinase [Planctomycetaceae bacterium]